MYLEDGRRSGSKIAQVIRNDIMYTPGIPHVLVSYYNNFIVPNNPRQNHLLVAAGSGFRRGLARQEQRCLPHTCRCYSRHVFFVA